MRILVVVHDFLPETLAGTEVLAQQTIEALRQKKDKGETTTVGLFTSYYHPPRKEDIPVDLPQKHIYLLRKKKSAALFGGWSPRARRLFRRALRKFRPDTVYFFHTLFLSFDLPLLAKRYGARVVYYLHDFYLICPRGTLLARDKTLSHKIDRINRCVGCLRLDLHPKVRYSPWLKPLLGPTMTKYLLRRRDRQTRLMLERVDAFISPSQTVAQAIIYFGLEPDKMHIVPYGLPPLVPSTKHPTTKFHVGFIGTLSYHKGLSVLLKAATYLDHQEYQINLFGQVKDAAFLPLIKQLPHVTYHGAFSPANLQNIYDQIDILVAPSLWFENQPLVILQAYQTRTPVITSDLGGLRELVKNGQTGLLFPVGNAHALADAINRLRVDTKLYQSIQRCQAQSPLPLSLAEHLRRVWPLLQTANTKKP